MLEPSKQLNNGVKGMYGRWPNDESNHPFAIHRAKRGSPSRRAWPLWPVPNWRKVANQKSVSRGEPSLRDYIFFYPPPPRHSLPPPLTFYLISHAREFFFFFCSSLILLEFSIFPRNRLFRPRYKIRTGRRAIEYVKLPSRVCVCCSWRCWDEGKRWSAAARNILENTSFFAVRGFQVKLIFERHARERHVSCTHGWSCACFHVHSDLRNLDQFYLISGKPWSSDQVIMQIVCPFKYTLIFVLRDTFRSNLSSTRKL